MMMRYANLLRQRIRRARFYPALLIVLAFTLYGFTSLIGADRPPVVIRYAHIETPMICGQAGEVLHYRVALYLRDSPANIFSVGTVWDTTNNQTAIWAENGRYAIIEQDMSMEQSLTYELPQVLPRGQYKLLIAYQTLLSLPAVVALPFTVEGCP
jgi:hypothetical protein